MQQYKALFLKEFGGFFRNISAYIILALYWSVSVGCAIFFGSYLEINDNGLFTLFYAQPFVLAILIPSLTMRSWSEEFRSGTAEFLLTQPVDLYKIVLIKFCAIFCLCFIMSIGLLPFIFYTAKWISLDWGIIFISFVGIWMISFLFTALGGFISALCRNIMLAYIIAVAVIGCWISVPFIYFYSVFQNFLFAEIGVPDLFYFLSFTTGFIILQILAVEYQRLVIKNKTLKLLCFAFFLIFGISCLWLFSFNLFLAKVDFTTKNIYSLKSQTKEIIDQINEPIYADFIVTKDYLAQDFEIGHFFEQVKRFAQKYQNYSHGMIKININTVDAFSALEENAVNKGVFFEYNAQGSRNIFGAILRNNNDDEIVIKQILPQRKAFLEKDIDKALLQIIQPQLKKNIGIYLDTTQNLSTYQGVLQNLENDYNLLNINASAYEFSNKMDLLILFNPKKLSDNLMYAIDQYMVRGGRVLFLLDAYTESQGEEINQQELSADQFFAPLGLSLASKNLTNTGTLTGNIYPEKQKVILNNALVFNVHSNNLQVTPFIENNEGLIGVVLKGKVDSLFMFNPFWGYNDFALKMKPHADTGTDSIVAIIGDSDWIEDQYWIDDRSADRNPFSVIEKSSNLQAFRALVDFLVANDIYRNLPINGKVGESVSISDKIQEKNLLPFQVKLENLYDTIQETKNIINRQNSNNTDKLQEPSFVNAAGRKMAEQEDILQNILYQIQQKYAYTVQKIIFSFVIVIPFGIALLLWLLMRVWQKRANRKIMEIFDE